MESSQKSGIGLKVGLGILLVLFLGTAFYASKLYSDKQETEKVLISEKQQVMKDLSNMAKDYDAAIAKGERTNQDLIDARERIQNLMDSLKVSQNSVNSLWRYRKKYLALQEEMEILLEENDRLKVENELLAVSLDSTQVQLKERTMFTDSLLVQNTELANVVEDAAALQTVGLKGLGVIERRSGKQIPTERARRSDKIKICFTVAKNTLTEAGDKGLPPPQTKAISGEHRWLRQSVKTGGNVGYWEGGNQLKRQFVRSPCLQRDVCHGKQGQLSKGRVVNIRPSFVKPQ